jgi:hypothetical protein
LGRWKRALEIKRTQRQDLILLTLKRAYFETWKRVLVKLHVLQEKFNIAYVSCESRLCDRVFQVFLRYRNKRQNERQLEFNHSLKQSKAMIIYGFSFWKVKTFTGNYRYFFKPRLTFSGYS